MHPHPREDPGVNQTWTLIQENLNDWSKETQKKFCIKVTQTTTKAKFRDSPSESAQVSIHTYYTLFLNKYFICFTTFCLCRVSFLQSWRSSLSLTTGLVVRVQGSHHWDPTSNSGWEPKSPSSCHRLRPLDLRVNQSFLVSCAGRWQKASSWGPSGTSPCVVLLFSGLDLHPL